MAGNYRFVRQTQNVVNQYFLGYYSDTAYGMLFLIKTEQYRNYSGVVSNLTSLWTIGKSAYPNAKGRPSGRKEVACEKGFQKLYLP